MKLVEQMNKGRTNSNFMYIEQDNEIRIEILSKNELNFKIEDIKPEFKHGSVYNHLRDTLAHNDFIAVYYSDGNYYWHDLSNSQIFQVCNRQAEELDIIQLNNTNYFLRSFFIYFSNEQDALLAKLSNLFGLIKNA